MRFGMPFLAAVAACATLNASCATRQPKVVLSTERIYIVENGRIVDSEGVSPDSAAVEGWYVISPGSLIRLLEK